jgi:hypothetical protein
MYNDEDSPPNREIQMWRQRFIEEYKLDNFGKEIFLSFDSQYFMIRTPEDHLKDLIEHKETK